MPWSNFYWEMSVDAVKREEKGQSTYSTHSTVRQDAGRVGVGGDDESTNSLLPT